MPCPRCRGPLEGFPPQARFCFRCLQRLELPPRGLRGGAPLPFPWWAAGSYAGALRSMLLDLKRRPRPSVVDALLAGRGNAPAPGGQAGDTVLTPIPGWKRGSNALPAVMAMRLARHQGWRQANLLELRHPVLGQHRLHRRLREANQREAFRCREGPAGGKRAVILLDDILTSGATLRSAAAALAAAGWQVRGAVCLARTPRPARDAADRDLGSMGRCRDGEPG